MSVRQIKDYRNTVLEQFDKGSQVGEPSGYPFLDTLFKIRPGFFYTCTGWPGSGKSEFVMNLAILQAKNANRKIAFYSPESYPVESFIATMVHCYLGKATDKHYGNCCSRAEFEQALDWLDEYIFLLNYDETPTHLMVLEDFQSLKSSRNVKVFVLDPFNSLTGDEEGGNMAVQLKDVLNKFVLFTHNERVIFFCIEHPKTPRDHEDARKVPGPYQLFGGSMWWNKSDCIFAVHSLREDNKYTGDVIFRTWKMKNQKLNGSPGEFAMYFDIKTNRYYERKPEQVQKELTLKPMRENGTPF